jgi:hypothetical protein
MDGQGGGERQGNPLSGELERDRSRGNSDDASMRKMRDRVNAQSSNPLGVVPRGAVRPANICHINLPRQNGRATPWRITFLPVALYDEDYRRRVW